MKSERPAAVIIVGGGYSGTVTAAQLERRGLTSIIVEGSGREGRGTAFSTPDEAHLLNVAAGRMGAFADRPEGFAEAIASEGHDPSDYVPRRRYGEYLEAILEKTLASGSATLVRGQAVGASPNDDGWSVRLDDGREVSGAALVLAQGNQPPAVPRALAAVPRQRIAVDPWSEAGRALIESAAQEDGDVLIIGTGLTMIDVALSLDEAGHKGRIVALSRRGLAPRAHGEVTPAPVERDALPMASMSGMWRWLHERSKSVGWRAAVDSLRPHSQAIWQAWSLAEQRRFLRHARPWWDVHRHRIAPQVAERIAKMEEEGRLSIIAARIDAVEAEQEGFAARIRLRGADGARPMRFAYAFNCTGPLGSMGQSKDPLLRALIDQGLAKPDALDLGLAIDEQSRLIGAKAAYAVGPLTKGRYWEITAVPDIRGQIAQVADAIAEELNHALQP